MASEPEPVAWHWVARNESYLWPVWVMSRERPYEAPNSAMPLYDDAALLAAEQRGRDAERERCAKVVETALREQYRREHGGLDRNNSEAEIFLAAAIRKGDAT